MEKGSARDACSLFVVLCLFEELVTENYICDSRIANVQGGETDVAPSRMTTALRLWPAVAVFWAFVPVVAAKPKCTISATTFDFGLDIRAPLSVFSSHLDEYVGFDVDIIHDLAGHTGIEYTLHANELDHDNPNTSTAYIHTYHQPRPKLMAVNFTYSQPYLASHISCASQKYTGSEDPW